VLENQGFDFIYGGRVRAHETKRKFIIFKEKGVDVKIAVDIISAAYKKELNIIVLASSDSDLQPAVKELREMKIESIYLGFEIDQNRGLSYTTNRTILIRNSEVLEFLPKKLFNK